MDKYSYLDGGNVCSSEKERFIVVGYNMREFYTREVEGIQIYKNIYYMSSLILSLEIRIFQICGGRSQESGGFWEGGRYKGNLGDVDKILGDSYRSCLFCKDLDCTLFVEFCFFLYVRQILIIKLILKGGVGMGGGKFER